MGRNAVPAAWRNPGPRHAVLIASLALLLGCGVPGPPRSQADPASTRPVWLVTAGWHTGLAVRRGDIPKGLLPESGDFPGARYLELGWGDRDYYRASEPGLWLALKAALIPGPAVLHVAGLTDSPEAYFGSDEVLRIELPEAGFWGLVVYLDRSFARNGAPTAAPLGPGWYGDSRFYEARGRFHLFNNCNTWAARAFQAAGLPMMPEWTVTASRLRRRMLPWASARTERRRGFESGSPGSSQALPWPLIHPARTVAFHRSGWSATHLK